MNRILSYYELLRVDVVATPREIADAFRKRIKEVHPDKNGGAKTAEELTRYLNQANETLTDSKKRLEYDYIIGVKQRPSQQYSNHQSSSAGWGKLIGAATIGVIVGVALTSGNSS